VNGDSIFRKGLFPLVIVAAIVWLAIQTLGGSSSDEDFRFSDALTLARQGSGIGHVTFHPSSQEIDFHLATGKTRTAVYPVDQSAFELQQLLEDKHIAFEAKRVGSSPWWSVLTSLLPFVLLFGFWIFLMGNVRRREPRDPGRSQ